MVFIHTLFGLWSEIKTGEEDIYDRAILTVETSVSRDALFKHKGKTLVHWCLNRLDLMKSVLLH